MRIDLEISDRESCLNRAIGGEYVFTLLGRDECAPEVIELWAALRLLHGKNQLEDGQILEALECAKRMRTDFREIRGRIAQVAK